MLFLLRKVSLALFFFLLITGQANSDLFEWLGAAESSGSNNPCKMISEGDQIKKEPIFCIGRLGVDIAVVTHDLKIWLLNKLAVKEDVNGAINKLYFGTDPPVPMAEVWPELSATVNWKTLVNHSVPSCNTAADKNGHYMMLDSNSSEAPKDFYQDAGHGLGWNIDNKKVIRGFDNLHQDSKTRWIGNTDVHAFYAITDEAVESEGIRIVRYSLCAVDRSGGSLWDTFGWQGTSERPWLPSMGAVYEEEPNRCYMTANPKWYHLCLDGSDQVYVNTDRSKPCPTPAKWPLYNGFVDKGHFYLFSNDVVYSFPEEAYKTRANTTLRTIKYGEFIQCSGSPNGRDDTNRKNPITIGLIIAGILLLLLCLLCCLLCLFREAVARRKRAKGKKSGGKGGGVGKDGVGGGLFPGASARSKGLLPFGFLSGKTSKKNSVNKSKRSTRGLAGPGTLSKKKGGGASSSSASPTTKRSAAGPGTAGTLSASRKGMTKRSKGGLPSGKDITAAAAAPDAGSSGASKTKRSRAISKKGGGSAGGKRLSSNRSKKQRTSVSNKATERSKLKKRG